MGNYSVDEYFSNIFAGEIQLSPTFIVFLVLSVLGALAIYFVFAAPKNEGKYQGFAAWLYDVARFTKSLAGSLLKAIYFILTIFFTLLGLYTLFNNFGMGIMFMVGYNVLLRIAYELILLIFSIHENLVAIRKRVAAPEEGKKAPAEEPAEE